MPNYAITITGATSEGSTSTFQPGITRFTVEKNFQLPGILAVSPTITADNSAGNGVNAIDIGLFVASPEATVPLAGAIDWVSNSTLALRFIHGNFSQAAGIDDAIEGYNPATRTLTTVVDPNLARTLQLNEFITTGGLLSNISEVQVGAITVTFAPDNKTLTGTVDLVGGGLIEPGVNGYAATFIGVLVPGS